MLDSLMLVDQNMVCGSNNDQRDHFLRIHLDVSLFSGIHQICIPTFPFDPPMLSGTWYEYTDQHEVKLSAIFVTRLSSRAVYFHTNKVAVF